MQLRCLALQKINHDDQKILIYGHLLNLLGVAPTALTKKHRHSNSPNGLPC